MTQDFNLQFNSELDQKCKASVCVSEVITASPPTDMRQCLLSFIMHVGKLNSNICYCVCVCVLRALSVCVSCAADEMLMKVFSRCNERRTHRLRPSHHFSCGRSEAFDWFFFFCVFSFYDFFELMLLHTHTGDVCLSCSLLWFPDETLRRLNRWQGRFLSYGFTILCSVQKWISPLLFCCVLLEDVLLHGSETPALSVCVCWSADVFPPACYTSVACQASLVGFVCNNTVKSVFVCGRRCQWVLLGVSGIFRISCFCGC